MAAAFSAAACSSATCFANFTRALSSPIRAAWSALRSFSAFAKAAFSAAARPLIADAVRASKSSQDPATAAKLAAKAHSTARLPTQEDARVMCENAVAQGMRPRAILTSEGWYTHPEMARSKDTGVTLLGG